MKRGQIHKKSEMKSGSFDAMLQSPCTITEATQIAKGVTEDCIRDYIRSVAPSQASLAIQFEILKELLFKSNILDQEEFRDLYVKAAEDFNERQKDQAMSSSQEEPEKNDQVGQPRMNLKVAEFNVKTEQRDGESNESK